jgi:hypothetical protein
MAIEEPSAREVRGVLQEVLTGKLVSPSVRRIGHRKDFAAEANNSAADGMTGDVINAKLLHQLT